MSPDARLGGILFFKGYLITLPQLFSAKVISTLAPLIKNPIYSTNEKISICFICLYIYNRQLIR